MTLDVVSHAIAKRKYGIDLGDNCFMFHDGESVLVFNTIRLKELIADMTAKTQQDLYQFLYNLGCRINT